MRDYIKTVKVSLLAILAAIGIGVVAVYPMAPYLTSECLYNNYSNDVYDLTSTLSSQIDSCLLKPTIIAATITFVTSIFLLFLLSSSVFKEINKKFVLIAGLIYAPLQLLSLLLIQSNYLWKAQQAITTPEILRSYWFAIDPIIYFLIATSIAWWVTQKKKTS